MNISIQREVLHPVLQSMAKVIEDKPTAASIFSHVLLEAEGSSLRLTGTGPELEISGEVNCEVIEKGRITVPARKFNVICQHMGDKQTLSLALHEKQACVKANENEYFLNTLPAEDFPVPEEEAPQYEYRIQQVVLRELLEKTRHCIAQDDVRQYLNGLLMEFRGRQLRGVATDSHCLALCDVEVLDGGPVETAPEQTEAGAGKESKTAQAPDATGGKASDGEEEQENPADVSLILPRRAVDELTRLLQGQGEAQLKIMQGKIQVTLNEQKIRFGSRLIEGRFPDYRRVIPEMGGQQMAAERKQLIEMLSQVISFIQDRFPCVRLTIDEKQLKLQASSPENERLSLRAPAIFSAKEMEISFNAQYLHKILDTVDSEKAGFYFNGPEKSCLILPFRPADGGKKGKKDDAAQKEEDPQKQSPRVLSEYKFVVMPMRT